MKKIFTILLLVILLIFTSSCSSAVSRRVIGDEYVVTSVKVWNYKTYGTRYYVKAVSVNKHASAYTFNGNEMVYYTNTLYSVGDTIKLYNSSKIK